MTYKAGDNVVNQGKVYSFGKEFETFYSITDGIITVGVPKHSIRPATPVEIAKQAVLDEVSSIANNSTELVSNLLDQLISEVKIQTAIDTLERMKQVYIDSMPTPNYDQGGVETPPIIGDETKLD